MKCPSIVDGITVWRREGCERSQEAQRGVVFLRGKPISPLWPGTPMQILFIALLWSTVASKITTNASGGEV